MIWSYARKCRRSLGTKGTSCTLYPMGKKARRILKRKRYRIPESLAAIMMTAVEKVDAARKGKDLERLRQTMTARKNDLRR